MKIYKLIPSLIVIFILQLSLVSEISIMGISPSLILVFIMITLYLFQNEVRCVVASIIVGFCLDIIVGSYMGIYALTLFLVAVFSIYYKSICNNENSFSLVPLTLVGTAIYNFIPFAFYAMADMSISIWRILRYTGVSFGYNLIIIYIMYFLMRKRASYRPPRSQYERYETI